MLIHLGLYCAWIWKKYFSWIRNIWKYRICICSDIKIKKNITSTVYVLFYCLDLQCMHKLFINVDCCTQLRMRFLSVMKLILVFIISTAFTIANHGPLSRTCLFCRQSWFNYHIFTKFLVILNPIGLSWELYNFIWKIKIIE